MLLMFKKWLTEDAGEVTNVNTANTATDDGFSKIPSKYMSGVKKDTIKTFDPDKKFGIKRKYSS